VWGLYFGTFRSLCSKLLCLEYACYQLDSACGQEPGTLPRVIKLSWKWPGHGSGASPISTTSEGGLVCSDAAASVTWLSHPTYAACIHTQVQGLPRGCPGFCCIIQDVAYQTFNAVCLCIPAFLVLCCSIYNAWAIVNFHFRLDEKAHKFIDVIRLQVTKLRQ
jgi:hypothetical protein